MPPRRSARCAAVAERQSSVLAPLPLPVVHRIFLSMPVDCRARASCVCRAWRDALAEPALWTRLHLSVYNSVSPIRVVTDPLFQGAAGRARGQLQQLDVSILLGVTQATLLAVVTANAGSLRELSVDGEGVSVAYLAALLRAAPNLQRLDACVACFLGDVARLMRAEPPFAPLRLRELDVNVTPYEVVDGGWLQAPLGGLGQVASLAALLADPALQPTLSRVTVRNFDAQRPEVMASLTDAVLARGLRELSLLSFTPPAAEPLARLVRDGVLTSLTFDSSRAYDVPFLDTAGAVLVAAALRANTTLESLMFSNAGLCRDTPAAATLLDALVGHCSLRALGLTLECEARGPESIVPAALAALVAADAPALQSLDVCGLVLGDASLTPLMDALPHNHHLGVLYINLNQTTAAFARERLLPAVRANTSLQSLSCGAIAKSPAEKAAIDFVCRRNAARR